jgi:hypothetical protein
MRNWFRGSVVVVLAMGAGLWFATRPAPAQTPAAAYKAPRTKDGKADLNGIWQSNNEANWDIKPHSAAQGPDLMLGAAFSIPPGQGVIEGGEIPYLPAAAAKQKENFANRMKLDPEVKCFLPGVPRATYMPYPFQIVESPQNIMFVYEYAGAVRVVNMGAPTKAPADSWMGWSNGHWEGDTLVVNVTDLNEDTWFDRAGDFHSNQMKVTERYTPRSPDTLMYEATIDDPKTFSRPWKMSMPLYRRVEKNAQIMEYKCVEFSEEVQYGHLRKQPLNTKK